MLYILEFNAIQSDLYIGGRGVGEYNTILFRGDGGVVLKFLM